MSQDGSIGIRQPDLPDRQIDNGVVTRSSVDYYRQRVEVPNLEAVEGATTDASVTGDSAGTNAAKLRGILKVLSDVWNAATHRVRVDVENTVLPPGAATQSSLLDVVTATQGSKTDLDAVSAVQGTTADAAVTGDTAGTVSAKLRGLSKMIADVWNSTTHRLAVDVQSAVAPANLTTYRATASAIAPATAATDVLTITGSGTKTIYVLRIRVSGTQTSGTQLAVRGIKRSTANSGGTSSASTAVPNDSNSAAATATVKSYTANPSSLGTAIGEVSTDVFFLPGSASVADSQLDIVFGETGNAQPLVLRGTTQTLAINLNGATVTGGSLSFQIEWAEV